MTCIYIEYCLNSQPSALDWSEVGEGQDAEITKTGVSWVKQKQSDSFPQKESDHIKEIWYLIEGDFSSARTSIK